MPAAARIGDITSHGGLITGPGVATVIIGGKPASVIMDQHVCPLPPISHQPTVSPFPLGSSTVLINGRAALRMGDTCLCGASIILGAMNVMIGG